MLLVEPEDVAADASQIKFLRRSWPFETISDVLNLRLSDKLVNSEKGVLTRGFLDILPIYSEHRRK